jgi:hypothetical protein
MEVHITEDQKRALADDGIVKLPGTDQCDFAG